jgi:hypothetical protein
MKLYELFIKKKTSQLNEVNMSPGALQSWSKKYAAEMNAGFEAELCFAGLSAINNKFVFNALIIINIYTDGCIDYFPFSQESPE